MAMGYGLLLPAIIVVNLAGCDRASAGPATVAAAKTQTAESCRACHQREYAAWSGTDHALANRAVDPVHDAAAFAHFHPPAGVGPAAKPDMILGHGPLWQPLLPSPGGRWQPHELAYDPKRQDWFNVFGHEDRQPGEWGHWTGRGMNWNSMCAQCHMTGYEKNYDETTDTYHSTWVEQGVSCIQCHGPMPADHGSKKAYASKSSPPFNGDRRRIMETCAPCHARNEPLTADFQPGDRYADHYRVVLPVDPGVFYPDGQQRDEDFNWTSVLLSRMGHAGVTCMDCHDPHTSKTILPTAHNELCLQCHAAPGRVLPSGIRAVPIDPVAHSHHGADSAGNSCIACHMPTTTYMQRSPRHDHGWLRPDPLLTKELGIPNACNRCHADRNADWAIAKTDAWFGKKMDSRQRARARAVAAAQGGQPAASAALLKLLADEDIPAWRATLLTLLAPAMNEPVAQAQARSSLQAGDPLERSAAVRLLTGTPGAPALLRPLLHDPVRLVRVDAEWALSAELPADSPERKELDAYLSLTLDQPAGRLRLGQDLVNRGQLAAGEQEMARAEAWDPNSPAIMTSHAQVFAALGRPADAGKEFMRAARLSSDDAILPMQGALAFAEAGRLPEAEAAFRMAVQRNPRFDRAWYNLGLLLAQTGRREEAVEALKRAMNLAPREPDYPYALATVLLQTGDTAGARAAARRTLELAPNHNGARQVMDATR